MNERLNSGGGENPGPEKKLEIDYATRLRIIQEQFKNLAIAKEAEVVAAFQAAHAMSVQTSGSEKEQFELVKKAAFARMQAMLASERVPRENERLEQVFNAAMAVARNQEQ